MDSKLVVEQMAGRWKVKHPDLIPLHTRARELAVKFDHVRYSWIPREKNSHADRLANQAMDAAAKGITPAAGQPTADVAGKPVPEKPTAPGWTGATEPPPGCCCCGTGRPNCRCNGATPDAVIRN